MKRLSAALFLCVAPSFAHAGLFGPDNFDECMVSEMKGQAPTMYGHVYKICRDKFPIKERKERKVSFSPSELSYTWSQGGAGSKAYVSLSINQNRTGYSPTRFVAHASEKPCNESKAGDFKHTLALKTGFVGSASGPNPTGVALGCFWLTEMYGYKAE